MMEPLPLDRRLRRVGAVLALILNGCLLWFAVEIQTGTDHRAPAVVLGVAVLGAITAVAAVIAALDTRNLDVAGPLNYAAFLAPVATVGVFFVSF